MSQLLAFIMHLCLKNVQLANILLTEFLELSVNISIRLKNPVSAGQHIKHSAKLISH